MLNKYGFDKNETITGLINKNGFTKTDHGLKKGGRLVFVFPSSGNKSRLVATWNFFKELNTIGV